MKHRCELRDFVRTGPSHVHRCRAFPFALAGLFLLKTKTDKAA